jgi:anti-anti-sigma factor
MADAVPRGREDFSMMTWPVDGAMVLSLGGELDIATASLLTDRVQALVDEGYSRIVLDLAHLDFCDCSGLRAFLRAREVTTEAGGWARLSRVGGLTRHIIELTGLADALMCYGSTSSAVGTA